MRGGSSLVAAVGRAAARAWDSGPRAGLAVIWLRHDGPRATLTLTRAVSGGGTVPGGDPSPERPTAALLRLMAAAGGPLTADGVWQLAQVGGW